MWPPVPIWDPGHVSRSAILQLQTWYMNKCFKSSQPLTPSGLYATLLGFGHNKIVVAVF